MKKLKVLIVDDNQDLADGLGVVLESENYSVSIAYNGADGIKKIDSEYFDVAFVDIKLPDMSGVEIFQYISDKNTSTKTIMMTGFRIEQVISEVISNGDVEVLLKPFEIGSVLESLKKVKNESIILIADDDSDFSEGLSEYLADHGLKTMIARNGQEALDGVMSNPVEVLVLDLRMPVMCGLDVYLKLKEKGRAVKTIIVTGYAQEEKETVDILKSSTVTGCLFKPFKPIEMLQAIEHAIACSSIDNVGDK